MKSILVLFSLSVSILLGQTGGAATPVVSYNVVSNWSTGLTASVTITNPGPAPISNWTAQFTYPLTITSIWGARITAHTGNVYSIANDGSYPQIPAGGSVTVGWTATGATGALSGCSVNNVTAACGAVPPPQGTQTLPPVATYLVHSAWANGLQGEIRIQNPNPTPINGWELRMTYTYNITNVWNATMTFHTGNEYKFVGAAWNTAIPPAGSISFGFTASTSTDTTALPVKCFVNSLAVSSPSCPASSPTADTTPPAVPVNVTATVQPNNSVLLAWSPSTDTSSGVLHYIVWTNGIPGPPVKATSTRLAGFAPGTAPIFAVSAVDRAGNQSAVSAPVKAFIPGPTPCPAPPISPASTSVIRATGSTITLAWTASPGQRNCTTSYTVSRASRVLASQLTGTTWTVTGLAPGTAYSFSVTAVNQAGSAPAVYVSGTTAGASAPPVVSSWPTRVFAPYVDVTLWPTPSLTAMLSATQQKYYTLAFVRAANGCVAAWGGYEPFGMSSEFTTTVLQPQITALRKAGGDAIVSFSTGDRQDLSQACPSTDALAAQYRQVIAATQATRLDFYMLSSGPIDPSAVTRHNQAVALLQQEFAAQGKALIVQYTFAAKPAGLDGTALSILSDAKSNGATVSTVNLMAMNYGPAHDSSKMAEHAIHAAQSAYAQLHPLYGSQSEAQRWAMIGLTPMIGLNDVSTEKFTPDDARAVAAWAVTRGIGLLSMWSASRDKSCSGFANYVAHDCSSVPQSPYEFTRAFLPFTR